MGLLHRQMANISQSNYKISDYSLKFLNYEKKHFNS
jgi:hypothetical protein